MKGNCRAFQCYEFCLQKRLILKGGRKDSNSIRWSLNIHPNIYLYRVFSSAEFLITHISFMIHKFGGKMNIFLLLLRNFTLTNDWLTAFSFSTINSFVFPKTITTMTNEVMLEKTRIGGRINNWHQLGSKWPVNADLFGNEFSFSCSEQFVHVLKENYLINVIDIWWSIWFDCCVSNSWKKQRKWETLKLFH